MYFTSWMSIAACFITLNIYGGVYVQGLVKFENQREDSLHHLSRIRVIA